MKKKDLKRRLKDLELQRRLITDVIVELREAAQVKTGNYAMYLLMCGTTAEQADMIETFWQWADRQEKSTLTREQLLAEFDVRAPVQLKGALEGLLMAHRRDGTKSFYCDLVLGKGAKD
jgi:hypothetical protein